jgi:hypothetical protein
MKPIFDVGKALTFGLDVFTARPMAFVTLAIWTVLYAAALGVFQIQATGAALAALSDVSAPPSAGDSTAVFQAMGQTYISMLPFFAIAMILGVVVEAAWLRLFVRGQDGGIFPFRLGRDEGHYFIAGLGVLLLLLSVMTVAAVVMLLLSLIFALLGPIGAGIGAMIGILAMMGAYIVALIWLSPVLALTLLRGRLSIAAGIAGARRVFWPLLGGMIVSIVVFMLVFALMSALTEIMPFDQYGILPDGDVASWAQLFPYYAIVQVLMIAPAAMTRGVACYAALQIDEAAPGSDAN